MIPKAAIEKAIEGRWTPPLPLVTYPSFNKSAALDPSFWQSLGKALGWGKTDYCWGCGYDEGETISTDVWFVNAHRFYDLILTGSDTDAFWKELLTNKSA